MVVAEKGDTVYVASEECAIRAICPDVENVWSPPRRGTSHRNIGGMSHASPLYLSGLRSNPKRNRCIRCRVCERQCANEVHQYDCDLDRMIADESKCVNCHRCVSLCPTRALKIVKTDHDFRENANWSTGFDLRPLP
jgi:ferredoxin